MKEPRFLKTVGEIAYYTYQPSLFRPYAKCFSKEETPPYTARIVHRLRMLREMIFARYTVVYMKRGQRFVGSLVVSRGGTRIAMSNKDDIVIGPIWIVPDCRGQGLGSAGIHAVLHSLGFEYRYAYEYIDEKNTASMKTVEKNGFRSMGRFKEFGIMKTIKPFDKGNLRVYRFERSEESLVYG